MRPGRSCCPCVVSGRRRDARRSAFPPGGFTLLEVIVALAVGGMVTLGAAGLLVQLAADGERTVAASRAADAEANGERLLRALVGGLEPSPDETPAVVGTREEAAFTSWCDVPAGWQERCSVTLSFGPVEGGKTLVARLGAGEGLELRSGFREGSFLYLADPARGGTWLESWSGITTPLALALLLDADTLVLRIGERG